MEEKTDTRKLFTQKTTIYREAPLAELQVQRPSTHKNQDAKPRQHVQGLSDLTIARTTTAPRQTTPRNQEQAPQRPVQRPQPQQQQQPTYTTRDRQQRQVEDEAEFTEMQPEPVQFEFHPDSDIMRQDRIAKLLYDEAPLAH